MILVFQDGRYAKRLAKILLRQFHQPTAILLGSRTNSRLSADSNLNSVSILARSGEVSKAARCALLDARQFTYGLLFTGLLERICQSTWRCDLHQEYPL